MTEHWHAEHWSRRTVDNGDVTICHHPRESGNANLPLWFLAIVSLSLVTACHTPARRGFETTRAHVGPLSGIR